MAEYYTVVTDIGLQLLNDCLISQKIFPGYKMAVGDSNGVYYEPEKTQTALKNQKYITNVAQKGKKGNYIFFNMQIPPSEGDYTIREVGLFDKENNLLAVAKYPETVKQKTSGSSNKTIMIEIQIELSDNAINTIIIDNSGNLVTEEQLKEYQKLNEKGVKNGYTPLNEQAQIPYNHIPAPYNVFCVNSGIVGSYGLPTFLRLEENTLKTVGSFDLTTAQGVTYTIPDELTKDVSGLSDGEYNIFINPETKEISLKNNKIHIDNKFPSDAEIGDYLLNIAKPPFDLEEKTASENLIGLKEVYAGSLSVSGEGRTLKLFNYNFDHLKADIDLSNLTDEGEKHFANPNLSNLSSNGETHFDNKFVKKTGDTMTGELKFTGGAGSIPLRIYCGSPDSTGRAYATTLATSNFDMTNAELGNNGGWNAATVDKNGEIWAASHHLTGTSIIGNQLYIRRKVGGVVYTGVAQLIADAAGNIFFEVPTPSSDSDDVKTPNTKWVRNLLSRTMTTSGSYFGTWSKAQNGYFKFSNGIIIQWGTTVPAGDGIETTQTFPVAFTSCIGVWLTRVSTRGHASYDIEIFPHSWSNTFFTYKAVLGNSSNFRFLAIGY